MTRPAVAEQRTPQGRDVRTRFTRRGLARVSELWPAAAAFVASRVLVLLCLYVAPLLHPGYRRMGFFTDWDATPYLSIAEHGYPPPYPPTGGFDAHIAFFPLLPGLIRALHLVGVGDRSAGILVANAATLTALCVLWILAREVTSPSTASRTAVLLAFWPASFVLSMIYSDSLLILFAAGCLLALIRQRWMTAGALGLLASAARPNGLVLVLCCAWAAGNQWRKRRALYPLVSVVLAPLGAAGYFAYLWDRFGSPTIWFTAEHRGWGQGFDFGRRWVSDILVALQHPTGRVDLVASSVAGIIAIALVAWMIRERLPAVLTIYSAGIVVLALGSGFGGSIPRFCLDAFPMFIAPAIRLKGVALQVVVGLSAATFVLLFFVVELTRTTVP
ncbi:MAG TPA: mannosyltransferase family protein [Acidimicrobiales bacterium]|nr:mannosyltransferase family protein [Acidimicrobiales bacterium]